MKTARIMLPHRDKDGYWLRTRIDYLRRQLDDEYGGSLSWVASHSTPNGPFKHTYQDVIVFEVMLSLAEVPAFRALAAATAKGAGLDQVMIVTPNGDVEFVKAVQ